MASTVDFEQALQQHIKPNGRWQVKAGLLILTGVVTYMAMYPQLTSLAPPHRCAIPLLDSPSSADPLNDSAVLSVAIPRASPDGRNYRGHASCTQYNMSLLLGNFSTANASAEEVYEALSARRESPRLQVIPCQHGWRYDQERAVFRNSFAQRFDLVCQSSYLIPAVITAYQISGLFGRILGGLLADIYGRKVVAVTGATAGAVTGILVALSQHVWMLAVLRALAGFVDNAAEVAGVVWWSEMTDTKHRNFAFMLFGFHQSLVVSIVPIVFAYFVQDWRYVHVFMSIQYWVALFLICLVPESPRWLLATGRFERAFRAIRQAIVCNRGPNAMTEDELAEMENSLRETYTAKVAQETEVRGSWWRRALAIFTSSTLRHLTICFSVAVLGNGVLLMGFNMYVVRLQGLNPFLVAGIGFATCLPGLILKGCLHHFFERRRPLVAVYLTLAGFCAAQALLFIFSVRGIVHVVLSWISLGLIFAGLYMNWNYAAECFPTVYRNYALGFVNAFSKVGSSLGSFIQALDTHWQPLPMLLFAVTAVVAAAMYLLLPKNANSSGMQDTVADMKDVSAVPGRKPDGNRLRSRAQLSCSEVVPTSTGISLEAFSRTPAE